MVAFHCGNDQRRVSFLRSDKRSAGRGSWTRGRAHAQTHLALRLRVCPFIEEQRHHFIVAFHCSGEQRRVSYLHSKGLSVSDERRVLAQTQGAVVRGAVVRLHRRTSLVASMSSPFSRSSATSALLPKIAAQMSGVLLFWNLERKEFCHRRSCAAALFCGAPAPCQPVTQPSRHMRCRPLPHPSGRPPFEVD